jgi:hypothetical protein
LLRARAMLSALQRDGEEEEEEDDDADNDGPSS